MASYRRENDEFAAIIKAGVAEKGFKLHIKPGRAAGSIFYVTDKTNTTRQSPAGGSNNEINPAVVSTVLTRLFGNRNQWPKVAQNYHTRLKGISPKKVAIEEMIAAKEVVQPSSKKPTGVQLKQIIADYHQAHRPSGSFQMHCQAERQIQFNS